MSEIDAVITCVDLRKQYGRKKVLLGVDLAVPPGVIFALLGTNGAGKTTLIRTVLGLIPRTSGKALMLGQDPWEAGAAVRQHIGYVSEEQGLYGWMRVSQLVRFCRGLYANWNEKLVGEYLRHFSLDPKTRVGAMSKGQKVRLALILALAPEPDLLILDEPMSGLDPLAQHEFLRIIQQVAVKEGRTIFFSTHNLPDVEAIATHLAILNAGAIKITGKIEEVKTSVRRVCLPAGAKMNLPSGAVLLERQDQRDIYLFPAGSAAHAETAAGSDLGSRVIADEPASLREVFLYYCAGRENDGLFAAV